MRLFRAREGAAGPVDRPPLHMQIVAHADDDLYFMNPDVANALAGDAGVVNVYLTGGEADGRNIATNAPDRTVVPQDYEGYVGARYNGIRAAYGKLLLGDRDAKWRRDVRTLKSGVSVEVARLVDTDKVALIFFSLRRQGGHTPRRLRLLWNGTIDQQPTLCPTGGPVSVVQHVTHDALQASLLELLGDYRPTIVRIMDLDPDHTSYDAEKGTEYCDNEDHAAAAMIAAHALGAYNDPSVVMESYRGYWNKYWPHNLSGTAFAAKRRLIDVYGAADPHECADPSVCGDLQLGDRAYNRGYGQSTATRFPGSTSWLRRGGDGRLFAFAVIGGRPMMWTETAPASGTWKAPTAIGDGYLAPQVNVVAGPDGTLHLLAMRLEVARAENGHRRDIVTTTVGRTGSVGKWTNIGNPYNIKGFNPIKRREIGMPAMGIGHDGRRRLFVRNFGSGLSSLSAGDGGWGDWEDLRGTSQDGIAVITTAAGVIEAYCATKTGVLKWTDAALGAPVDRDYALPFPAPAGPPTVLPLADGRLTMLVRQPSTAWVLRYTQDAPGEWNPQPVLLTGNGGYGPLAAVELTDSGTLAVAQRDDDGRVSITWLPVDGREPDRVWTSSGPLLAGSPSLAVDASGRLVAAAVGTDGQMYTMTSPKIGVVDEWRAWTR